MQTKSKARNSRVRSIARTWIFAPVMATSFLVFTQPAAASHQPVRIAGKRSSAVLVSAEDWQAIQETLYLLAIPGMRESIKKGMAEPLARSARELAW